jgi:hypothetical protein
MCVTNATSGNRVWLWVERAGGNRTIELMDTSLFMPVFLDDASYAPVPSNFIVTGLARFNDNIVSIVTYDPARKSYTTWPDQIVSGGTVTLDPAATGYAIIGYKYDSQIKTLKQDNINPYGTSQGMRQRWVRIIARLSQSLLPLINGFRPVERDPVDVMDLSVVPVTGDVEVGDIDWDKNGVITVEFDQPGRSELQALFGVIAGGQI